MTRIGTYQIEELFEISGRGPVFTGKILDGVLLPGNYLEFSINQKSYRRKIRGVDLGRKPHPEKMGVLGVFISASSKEETQEWKQFSCVGKALVYSEKLSLRDTQLWYAKLDKEKQILFVECLLSDMTVMNRAIGSDDNTSDQEKVEALRWSNELAHQIWNIHFSLKSKNQADTENPLTEHINFYAKQSAELAGHLAATLNSSIDRFYAIKEKDTQ